jgi:hypothetical protein
MPQYIDAYGFIYVTGKRRIYFGCLGCFMPKEKIALNDFPQYCCGILVSLFNAYLFLRVGAFPTLIRD